MDFNISVLKIHQYHFSVSLLIGCPPWGATLVKYVVFIQLWLYTKNSSKYIGVLCFLLLTFLSLHNFEPGWAVIFLHLVRSAINPTWRWLSNVYPKCQIYFSFHLWMLKNQIKQPGVPNPVSANTLYFT